MKFNKNLALIFLFILIFQFCTIEISKGDIQGISKIQGPKTPIILASNKTGYSLMAINDNYVAYFKGNSKTSNSIFIKKGPYSFEIDLSMSQLQWYNSIIDSKIDMEKNIISLDTIVKNFGNDISYSSAFIDVDIKYSLNIDEIKETLIINKIPLPTSDIVKPDYLQYVSNCYYTNNLTIVIDDSSYLNPKNERLITKNEIFFKDSKGEIIFILPIPYIYDSSKNINPDNSLPSNLVYGEYDILANDGTLTINIRIPKEFVDKAIYPLFFDPPIRVQGNARGTSTTNSISVTLGSIPISGNVLIAVISTRDYVAKVDVTSISQTSVDWTYQIANDDAYRTAEIWFGVVSAGSSTSITINLSDTPNFAVANICEYSGVAIIDFLDKTAINSGYSTSSDTGTTANTSQNDELWIGGISASDEAQTTPTNSFTLLDGALFDTALSSGYLEKIVSSIGTANSGTTISSAKYWIGVIATFKAGAPPAQFVLKILFNKGIQTLYIDGVSITNNTDSNIDINTIVNSTAIIKPNYIFFKHELNGTAPSFVTPYLFNMTGPYILWTYGVGGGNIGALGVLMFVGLLAIIIIIPILLAKRR